MYYFEEQNGSLLFRENGKTVMITPWGPDSLRVRATMSGQISDESDALLEPEVKAEASIVISEEEAVITNGKIKAVVAPQTCINTWEAKLRITIYDAEGNILLQEGPNGGALVLRARHFKTLPGGLFSLKATFVANPNEKIYGMGQYQQEQMDLKGCTLELAQRNSQASIPFYVSSLGYGFLWNNAAVGEVNFSTNKTQWSSMAAKQLDYWITAGDTPAEIMAAYANVTGKAPMMPEYGLGFWQCKLRYYNQQQVLDIAREYHKRNIPVDVFVIDYYHWPRCGDWRFDPEFFPDPEPMVKELKEMGGYYGAAEPPVRSIQSQCSGGTEPL